MHNLVFGTASYLNTIHLFVSEEVDPLANQGHVHNGDDDL